MSNLPISPEVFWGKFSQEIQKEFKKSEVIELYKTNGEWTPYITEFLNNLASIFKFVTENEYGPRLDVAYFDKPTPSDWDEWALEVAIEHENNFNTIHEELCKLLLVQSGLKVVITYYEDNESLKILFEKFKEIYESRKYHQEKENWLFIFGPTSNNWEEDDFVAYKFDGKEIKSLTGDFNIFN